MKKVNWLTFGLIFFVFALVAVSYASLTGVFSHDKTMNAGSVVNSQWKEKQAFINTCLTAESTHDRTKGDTAKAQEICSCLAEKVEAKYPEGKTFPEATTEPAIKDIGAEFCYKK